jgi:D-serine deaminase-like pyridoxal phosphate-dependent protein
MRVPEIDTPALVVDLERMERNIATMARFCGGREATARRGRDRNHVREAG